MSQQYSPQKALPSASNLKSIALSSHASSRESSKRKSFLIFLLGSAKQDFQWLCLSDHKTSKVNCLKEILKYVMRSHLVLPKFSVTDEEEQNTSWSWQGLKQCSCPWRRHDSVCALENCWFSAHGKEGAPFQTRAKHKFTMRTRRGALSGGEWSWGRKSRKGEGYKQVVKKINKETKVSDPRSKSSSCLALEQKQRPH